MKVRRIGEHTLGAIGLGCMGMSFAYGPADDQLSLKVLERALELGVNHWDTADMYGAGKNELLLAQALKTKRDQVFLATKFANVFDRSLTSHQDLVAAGAGWIVDGTPEYITKSLDNSLQRLGVDHVDLYYQHRVDERVPIEETVGALAEKVKQGKIKNIGLSEASAETIRRASKVHPIAAVQNELSLWTQDYRFDVLPACKELGITFVAYSPLGRGFLTGVIKSIDDLPADDWRRNNPRFQGENFQTNLDIVAVVKTVAEKYQVPAGQIALAWVLALGDHVAPIPGTKQVKYLEQNAEAASIVLNDEDFELLNKIQPPQGTRYPEAMMSFVNR